jgi:beta-mannosidase
MASSTGAWISGSLWQNSQIRAMNEACIRGVSLRPVERDGQVSVAITVTVDRFHYYRTGTGTVRVALSDQQGRSAEAAWSGLLRSGYNDVEFEVPLADPQFWWPNGMGEPHLYRVEAELEVGEERAAYSAFDYGLRTLELETAWNPIPLSSNMATSGSTGA